MSWTASWQSRCISFFWLAFHITSRQVWIQPHAVCFSSLYSFPIPLPDKFFISCDKHYFQRHCTLQEQRVIHDVFWFSAHFLLLPRVALSAPLAHSVFRLVYLHGPAAFGEDHLSLQQLTVLEKMCALLDVQEHKKKKSRHYSIHTNQAHKQQCCRFLS